MSSFLPSLHGFQSWKFMSLLPDGYCRADTIQHPQLEEQSHWPASFGTQLDPFSLLSLHSFPKGSRKQTRTTELPAPTDFNSTDTTRTFIHLFKARRLRWWGWVCNSNNARIPGSTKAFKLQDYYRRISLSSSYHAFQAANLWFPDLVIKLLG